MAHNDEWRCLYVPQVPGSVKNLKKKKKKMMSPLMIHMKTIYYIENLKMNSILQE